MGTIYYNGNIITMNEIQNAECIYEKDGIIEFVGSILDLKKICKDCDEWVDLKGNTICPSFIDSHSHITALSNTLNLCNLSNAKSFSDILNLIDEFKNKNSINENEWIIGFGYDNNFLVEKKHPDKFLLDKFDKNPVLISHASGHMGILNSLAIKEMGIDENTKNPEGGKIGRCENSNEPNGYFEETAFINISKNLPQPSFEKRAKLFKEAEKIYFSNGITTAQDGLVSQYDFDFLKQMAEKGLIDIDLVMYTDLKNCPNIAMENKNFLNEYVNNIKIGGYKIFLDGSPQGRTAYLRKPYENSKDYRGYPVYNDDELIKFFEKAINDDIQIIAHSNGDGASEQYLRCYKKAKMKKEHTNIRPVLIHGQLLGVDQLKYLYELNIMPSYFVSHVYYWGDIHKVNFGIERAERISPLKSTLDYNIPFTIHTDTPVILPNLIEAMWCAVNRITKNGYVLGECERIEPYYALKSITYNAAYQYFEEDKKGSIEKGKYADFVILDKNPVAVDLDKNDIKNIKVIKTIKRGKTVFDLNA